MNLQYINTQLQRGRHLDTQIIHILSYKLTLIESEKKTDNCQLLWNCVILIA